MSKLQHAPSDCAGGLLLNPSKQSTTLRGGGSCLAAASHAPTAGEAEMSWQSKQSQNTMRFRLLAFGIPSYAERA